MKNNIKTTSKKTASEKTTPVTLYLEGGKTEICRLPKWWIDKLSAEAAACGKSFHDYATPIVEKIMMDFLRKRSAI
jgi:hypothetical protein